MFTITTETIKTALEMAIAKLNFRFNVVIHEKTPQEQFDLLSKYVDFSQYKKEDLLCGGTTYVAEVDGKDEVKFFVDGLYEAVRLNVGIIFPMKEIAEQYLYEFISRIVLHEYRHSEQFQYIRQVGGAKLVLNVLADEIKAAYGKGTLEADAIAFSQGREKSFEEVFKAYLG